MVANRRPTPPPYLAYEDVTTPTRTIIRTVERILQDPSDHRPPSAQQTAPAAVNATEVLPCKSAKRGILQETNANVPHAPEQAGRKRSHEDVEAPDRVIVDSFSSKSRSDNESRLGTPSNEGEDEDYWGTPRSIGWGHFDDEPDEGISDSPDSADEIVKDKHEEFDPALHCNDIRQKINHLLDASNVEAGDVQRKLGITNSKAYDKFMKATGRWNGIDSPAYSAAYKFFKAREEPAPHEEHEQLKEQSEQQEQEQAQPPQPAQKKRKSNDGSTARPTKSSQKKKDDSKGNGGIPDVSSIHLDKEDNDTVEIYDTPSEFRRKITAILKARPSITKGALCRAFGAQFHPPKSIQNGLLRRFMSYTEPDQGNTSSIYYGAYVWFEKLRLLEGRGLTRHRIKMEGIWGGKGGYDTKRYGPSSACLTLRVSERASANEFGQLLIQSKGGRVRVCE